MRIAIFLIFLYLLAGCSTLKGYLGMGSAQPEVPVAPVVVEDPTPKYSDNQQMNIPENRQYKKMTRSRMEEESELHSQAGSMWISEGQGSYLFVQNKTRREGDVLNVTLEGSAYKQVETKVSVIKKLLKQLEEQDLQEAEQRLAAEKQKAEADRAPASEDAKAPAKSQPVAAKTEKAKEEKEEPVDMTGVANIQTKLVEKLADGNYRVKGQQPFMIGQREYKVIVTGLIRPEDFNDTGVSSSKLLDPQFDVVSIRRKISND